MENYQSINKAIQSVRKPVIVFSLIGLFIYMVFGAVLVNIALDKEDKSYSTIETCYHGMKSIFNNSPNENLLNKVVIADLNKMETNFNVDHIHLIKAVTKYECDVFSKDSKGVRRFLVKLEKNTKFMHLYRILDISERKVDSRYQIWITLYLKSRYLLFFYLYRI